MKNLLNLGTVLNKTEQKSINGGGYNQCIKPENCEVQTCSANETWDSECCACVYGYSRR